MARTLEDMREYVVVSVELLTALINEEREHGEQFNSEESRIRVDELENILKIGDRMWK